MRRAVLVISGDTRVCYGMEALSRDADVLVHQAVRSDAVPPNVLDWNASAESVGSLAQRSNTQHLVLTHLIPTPRDREDEQRFAAQARQGGYEGRLTIAEDLLEIALT